jgi:hypothetical protein
MTNKTLTETGKRAIDDYVYSQSVIELLDSIMCLDTIKSFAGLPQNGEVAKFLQKRNMPVVNSTEDFDYLYESLRDRLVEFRDKGDERVKTYLQRAEYRKQIDQLPVLISKLERITMNELKPTFKAVIEYVYDAVTEHGFKISEKTPEIPFDKYRKVNIGKDETDVYVRFDIMFHPGLHRQLNFFIRPVYELKTIEEVGWLGRKKKRVAESSNVEGLNIYSNGGGGEYCDRYCITRTIDEFFDTYFGDEVQYENYYKEFLKIIINLPKTMNDYLARKNGEIRGMLDSANGYKK